MTDISASALVRRCCRTSFPRTFGTLMSRITNPGPAGVVAVVGIEKPNCILTVIDDVNPCRDSEALIASRIRKRPPGCLDDRICELSAAILWIWNAERKVDPRPGSDSTRFVPLYCSPIR